MSTHTKTILTHPPENPGSNSRYLFYLHGLIVEEAGIRPKSEEHGYYEYRRILEELAGEGFVVISEAREKGTQIQAYAEVVAGQIKSLLGKGVAPGNIIVVGASKGGAIASYVSSILQGKEIYYVMLAGLFEKWLVDEDLKLYGKVLSIHDRADKLSITPEKYFQRSEGKGQFKAIVLGLDNGHGLIYQPYRQWIEPMLEWVKG
ncbi:MAG: hypothetical protein OEL83_05815 [Desulforhopalus sp.]|nr:hypothetical protein [Desulforhopalus sp.]